MREIVLGKDLSARWMVQWVMIGGVVFGLVVVEVMMKLEMGRINGRVGNIEEEMKKMRDFMYKDMSLQFDRKRRAIENSRQKDYNVEGNTKIDTRKYSSFHPDSTGFRLYNTWDSNKATDNTSTWNHRKGHHHNHQRQSAAVTRPEANEFLKFGYSMYSDASYPRITNNSASDMREITYKDDSINNPSTNTINGSSNLEVNAHTREKIKSPRTIRLNWKRRRQLQRDKKKMRTAKMESNTPGITKVSPHAKVSKNRKAVKSLGRKKLRSRDGVQHRKKVWPAIHLEADVTRLERSDEVEDGGVGLTGSIFRNWTPSRWATRFKMDTKFLLREGKLTVMFSGIYFVYAQINYLDNHDANAFQILINDSPIFLCITMVHKRRFSIKSNTCYTGGVTFLEQGDILFVKDLEKNRSAVMQSSHSFFGLAQLSGM